MCAVLLASSAFCFHKWTQVPYSLAFEPSHIDIPSAVSSWPCLTPSASHLQDSAWTPFLLGYLLPLLNVAMCPHGSWYFQCQNTHHSSFFNTMCLSFPTNHKLRGQVPCWSIQHGISIFQGQDIADSMNSNKYLLINSFKTSPVFMDRHFAYNVFRT